MPRNYRTTLASRERNRIHARKTRQRKKEQMQNLQSRAEELKGDQLRLRQIINEKNTANILVGLFAKSSSDGTAGSEDPQVEQLLRRPVQEIPDATKVPELPALILPGQHASKKIKETVKDEGPPNDGIDYSLLGKDRSTCTPEELDRIRRERNRMHAKRTRDRKRLFTEQMSVICRQLQEENQLLISHLKKVDSEYIFEPTVSEHFDPAHLLPLKSEDSSDCGSKDHTAIATKKTTAKRKKQRTDLNTLLQAVDVFERPQKKQAVPSTLLSGVTSQAPRNSPVSDLMVARNLVALSDDSSVSGESHGSSSHEEAKLGIYHHALPARTAPVGC